MTRMSRENTNLDEEIQTMIQGGCLVLPASTKTKYCDKITWSSYDGPISFDHFKELQNGFDGACIITGKRSGNIEVLDFDRKIDKQEFHQVLREFKEQVEAEQPGLLEKLPIEQTQKDGRHILYRCTEVEIPGNQKLARLDRETCLIETRGEGGLIICWPSPGYMITQGDLSEIPDITAAERDTLLKYAKAFNRYIEPSRAVSGRQGLADGDLRPGEDFNERGNSIPILEKHGWTHVFDHGPYSRLRRPGKSFGWSASLIDGKIFYVFSTSTEFEPEYGYSPFAVYSILEHEGDFQAAARELSKQGYGNKETSSETASDPLPPPPGFPLEVLPTYFAEAVQQASRAYQTPIEIPGATLVSLVGAMVGRSRAVVVKSGWAEHPNLFLALLARSGLGKSPQIRAFLGSVFKIEKERFDAYQAALAQYQEELEARKRQNKDERGPAPEKPTYKQTYVEDSTEEALGDALSSNPKGVLWYNDELSGLLLNLGRYRSDGKSEGPKARLMSSYDSGPWKRTRKSGDNAYIRHACLSILGSMQPAVLPQLFDNMDAASGFLPRFLFVRAEPQAPPVWTEETFEGEHRGRIDGLMEALVAYEMNGDEPHYIGMTREAQELYKEWFNEQAREPWRDFDAQQYEALSAKLRGQAVRLALILHVLDAHAAGESDLQPIQADTMRRALQLADWFKAHQRSIWQALSSPQGVTESSPLEKRVAAAIVALEEEIQGGKLPTARITEKVNEGVSKSFQVNSRSVGRVVSKLGLHTGRTNQQRTVAIGPEKLQKLKNTVTNVTNVTNPEKPGADEGDVLKNDVTNVTAHTSESDMSDVTNKNVTSANPHDTGKNDGSDVSDVFQRGNSGKRKATV
jgi:hypothetical protein